MSTEDEAPSKYIEGDLMKKEDKKKWVKYWAVVQGGYIIFYTYRSPSSELRDFYGCIKLNKNTRCIVAKRKKYSFPFYIVTDRARYLFKTNSNLARHQWLAAVDQASKGIPPNVTNCLMLPGDYIQDNSEICHNILIEKSEIDDNCNCQNEEDEEDENLDFNISTKLVYVSSAPDGQQISRFLERTFVAEHGEENESFEDLDLETTNPERFAERLHQIYCQDKEEEIMTALQPSSTHQDVSKCLVQTYGYPTHSKSYYLSSSVTRLTKSAESLRGFSLMTSPTSFVNSENLARESLFSRHMVNSAPDVKSRLRSNAE